MDAVRYWLSAGDGSRVRITPAGVLIGRAPTCDVVVADAAVSRAHALVYRAPEGPRVVVLGRTPLVVDAAAVEDAAALAEGSTVAVADATFSVVAERDEAERAGRRPAWVVEKSGGALFGIGHSPYVVGGGEREDLHIDGWPERAARFYVVDGSLTVEACAPLTLGGEALEAGEVRHVHPGSRITYGDDSLLVVTGGAFGTGTTAVGSASQTSSAPVSVRLEFLARGGRLHYSRFGTTHIIYLPGRRCDLLAVLLAPPSPDEPGSFVEDETVARRVWGKGLSGRVEINVLLHRLRRDLTNGGLDGPSLLERAEGGHATRFVLPARATVVVE